MKEGDNKPIDAETFEDLVDLIGKNRGASTKDDKTNTDEAKKPGTDDGDLLD